jgi:thymidylate kinase
MKSTNTHRGLFIVLIGPDGSGKSSVINSMLQQAASTHAVRFKTIHWRPAWLPHIGELFGKKLTYDPAYTDFTPHKAPPSGYIGSALRLLYYTIDFSLGFSLKIRPLLKAGVHIVFDRYYYDFIVDPERSRVKLQETVPYALLKMVPEPDFVFFLDNDPEVIFSRKKELTLPEIRRQLEKYREVTRHIRTCVTIPPASTIEDSAKFILQTISTDQRKN